MSELESLRKKSIDRANYRGTKEMDLLLSNFVDKYVNTFNERQLLDLYYFLNLEDDIIYDYYQKKNKNNKIKDNEVVKLFYEFKI